MSCIFDASIISRISENLFSTLFMFTWRNIDVFSNSQSNFDPGPSSHVDETFSSSFFELERLLHSFESGETVMLSQCVGGRYFQLADVFYDGAMVKTGNSPSTKGAFFTELLFTAAGLDSI